MSEPNALVNFRLDRDKPLRLKWLATDGVPGDGYKAQVTAIRLSDGSQLQMDSSSILEQTAADPAGGLGAYLVTFNGMVGFASDHPDRPRVDKLTDDEIDYDLEFITEEGRIAVENEDYKILERPRGHAHNVSSRTASRTATKES
jgi:hypothetical protein